MASNNHNISNEFEFRYITERDFPMILAHLEENFYLDEPVNQMLGSSENRVSDQHTRYLEMLKRYQKSIYITPKTGTRPNLIAGVLIVHIHDISNPLPTATPRSPITTNFLDFLEQAEGKYNVFEHHGVSAFPELAILSIDKAFRGRGLATELYRRGIAQLFSEGFPLIYTEFSNPFSRKVGEKLGFTQVGKIYFSACKTRDGTHCEEDFVSLMILENKS